MPEMSSISEVRRANLRALISEKYEGNRSSFSRATKKNVNLINLVLSNNPDHRRNIGERLARDLEQAVGLPTGWLDIDRNGGSVGKVYTFPVVRLGDASEGLEKLVLGADVVSRHLDGPASIGAVKACYMPSDEMAPAIGKGDLMFVDTSVGAVGQDGVYVLTRGKDVFVRRIRKSLIGGIKISADKLAETEDVEEDQINIAGRIVGLMRFGQP